MISTWDASWDAGGIVGFAFRPAPTSTILCGNTIVLRTSSAIQDIYAAEIWTSISESPGFYCLLLSCEVICGALVREADDKKVNHTRFLHNKLTLNFFLLISA